MFFRTARRPKSFLIGGRAFRVAALSTLVVSVFSAGGAAALVTKSSLVASKAADRGPAPAAASMIDTTLSVPVTTSDDATVTLATSWNTSKATFVAGSVVAPAKWGVEYYDGTTWSSTEPADPSVVENVRASGTVHSMGDGGDDHTLLTDSLAASKYTGPPGSFGASVGGDGYNLAFPDAERVVNVFHHNGPYQGVDVVFDCHLRTSGGACPGGKSR